MKYYTIGCEIYFLSAFLKDLEIFSNRLFWFWIDCFRKISGGDRWVRNQEECVFLEKCNTCIFKQKYSINIYSSLYLFVVVIFYKVAMNSELVNTEPLILVKIHCYISASQKYHLHHTGSFANILIKISQKSSVLKTCSLHKPFPV